MPVGAVSNRASVFRSPVVAVSNRARARCALTKRAYGMSRVRPNARVFRLSVGAVSNRARIRCALTKRAYGLADIGDAIPVVAVFNRARRRCALTKRAYGRHRVRPNARVCRSPVGAVSNRANRTRDTGRRGFQPRTQKMRAYKARLRQSIRVRPNEEVHPS